jgi:HEAT repeat protein
MGWFGKPDLEGMFSRADIQGLFQVLNDGSEIDQITAASMLIQLRVQRGFDHLIEMLGTGRAQIRAAAAETFGELRDTRAVAALAVTLDDPSAEVQDAARQALLDIDTLESQQALTEWDASHSDPDEEIQTFGFDPIMGSNRLPGFRKVLNPEERHLAAREEFTLANHFQEEARPQEALASVNKVLAVDPTWADALNLRGILHEELNQPFLALNDYRKACLYDSLLVEARTNLDELIRELDLAGTPANDWIEQTTSSDWEERQAAYIALSFSDHPLAFHTLEKGLADEDVEVITAVIEALEGLDTPAARQVLEEYYRGMEADNS